MPMKFLPSGASGASGWKSTTPMGTHSKFRVAYRTTSGPVPPVRASQSS